MELIAARPRPVQLAQAACHDLVQIPTTRDEEFVDITDRLERIVARAGVDLGVLNLQVLHTTAALILNEAEPLLFRDFAGTLDGIAPRHGQYEHDKFDRRTVNVTADERINGHAHCRALVLSATLSLNIVDFRVMRGQWQRIFLVELDGPQTRTVSALVIGREADARCAGVRTSPTERRFREALGR
jgi:secondary thiamine-phosphate synthase enzyme